MKRRHERLLTIDSSALITVCFGPVANADKAADPM